MTPAAATAPLIPPPPPDPTHPVVRGTQTGVPGYRALVVGAIVIAGLYYGREVLVPFALALLVSFLLSPVVEWLQRYRVPKVPGVLGVVVLAFTLFGLVTYFISIQLIDLASRLPQYQENIHEKLLAFHPPGGGLFSQTTSMVKQLSQDVTAAPAEAGAAAATGPIAVVLQNPDHNAFDLLRDLAGTVAGPLATASIIVILVIFMLIQLEDLRDRFISVIGRGRLHATTKALSDAGGRISRYLSMQILVNALFAMPVAAGLYFIGLPNPLLWGLLAGMLRFVPYIGPIIGLAMPTVLAFAVDPGWSMVAMTVALFVMLELFIAYVIEPWLYGHSTGLSPITIVGAALFWTMIWGPVGLLLSTPLTVCLAVLGRHVPDLSFFNVLLGSEQALPAEARFYQRLLALDPVEAEEIGTAFLQSRTLADLYGELVIPALSLAEDDRNRGILDATQKQFVVETTRALVERFPAIAAPSPAPATRGGHRVAIVPAHDESDELGGQMLAQLLVASGCHACVTPVNALLDDQLEVVAEMKPDRVVVSAVPPSALVHAIYSCRRIRARFPEATIMLGVWSVRADATDLRNRLPAELRADVVVSLRECVSRLGSHSSPGSSGFVAAPIPDNEDARMKALTDLKLLDTPPDEMVDRVTREVARIFNAPISLVSLVDRDRQFWLSQTGLPPKFAEAREASRAESICGHVVAHNELVVVPDVTRDQRFAGNPLLQEMHVRFYAGAPLRDANRLALGSLCVIDIKPRELSNRESELLQLIADGLMHELAMARRVRQLRDVVRQLDDDNRELVALQGAHRGAEARLPPS